MIHVIARITLKSAEIREKFIEIFNANIANVLAEDGCERYSPTIDIDSGIPVQNAQSDDVVTIVETWRDLMALEAHLIAPHMTTYREQVANMVDNVTLQVLEDV